ncbi:MAG: hypothetical protein QOD41_3374, partial [Cryptosporangiaceae bacterium]|nr:hypothetical protein [Cryptosporangiaceae bacterium]
MRLLGLPAGYRAPRWGPGAPARPSQRSRTAELRSAADAARPGAPRVWALSDLALWCADADPRYAIDVSEVLTRETRLLGNRRLKTWAQYVHTVAVMRAEREFADPYRVLSGLRQQFTALGWPVAAAWCDYSGGIALEHLGDPGGATVLIDRSVPVFREHGDRIGEARALNALGYGESSLGRHEHAQVCYQQAADLAIAGGCPAALSVARLNGAENATDLGRVALDEHRPDAARRWFDLAEAELVKLAELASVLGHRVLQPIVAACYGAVLHYLGRHGEALAACDRALQLAETCDSPKAIASARGFAGQVYLALGDPDRASALLTAALEHYGAWGLHMDTARTLRALVDAKEALGAVGEAYALHKRLLAVELSLRDANVQRENEVIAARLERAGELATQHSRLSRQNTRLEAERRALERLAHTDSLTGLANRRHFDAQLARLAIRSELSGRPLALVLIDVDHFKRVNDQFSHVAGDAVLGRVAKAITAHCTDRQLAARIGGEEFAVLLPGRGAAEAAATAERIRGTVARLVLDDLADGLRITVSAGVACGP